MTRTIEVGVAHVTSDVAAARAAPGYDPVAALLAAEALAKQVGRRLHADRITALREKRLISAAEAKAALEIRTVVEAAARVGGPIARQQFRERLAASTGNNDTGALLLDAAARFDRWKPWAGNFPVNAEHSLLELTALFVVEGLGAQQVADRLRVDRRRSLALLRRSLSVYAHMAG
jgi:hypothetical protein